MISKNFFFVFVLSFLVAGLFFLSTPEISFSQLGCCVSDSGPNSNCVGCGPTGSSCQSQQTGACPNTSPPAVCPDENGDWSNCFVAGAFCFQETNIVGVCQPSGCCQIEQGNCFQTNSATCATSGFDYLGDGSCLPQFDAECSPLGCCQTPGGAPNMCQAGVTQMACEGGGRA